MDIMEKALALPKGRVAEGAGNSYTLLDKFLKVGMIQKTSTDERWKNYIFMGKRA
ncbi:hypothetical protein [Proteiniclasticum ruminis]|uniref:hypothetical protein n=1 Tax=Proteiniclasticum ruminis TaxID=398199 RepID=UPI0028AB49A5|nr:hypothetical protein [Proteiniclasticum ruminis]